MPTAGEYFARQDEARHYITQNRRRLRPLTEGRCPADNRLLAAVYRLRDGFWLWRVGERQTREQVQRDTFPVEVDPLGDAVQAYHSLSLEQLRDRMPSGALGSCGRFRQTYVVDHAVLQWAAGQAVETCSRRSVTVLLGRVVLVREDKELLDGPVFSVVPPHWQAMPWCIRTRSLGRVGLACSLP